MTPLRAGFSRALLGLTLFCIGCASITERRRHQYVYIQSQPPGAVILEDGKALGTTPSLVRLRRHPHHELELQKGRERKKLLLETRYAWKESFSGNLVLFSLAPLGWLTDLALGTAWNYQAPAEVSLTGAAGPLKPPRIAIAPPLAPSYGLSDEAAQYWERELARKYPDAKIVPYQASLPTFHELGYEHDDRPQEEQRYREALYNIPADRLFLSDVNESAGKARLGGELKDPKGDVLEKHQKESALSSAAIWKDSPMESLASRFQFIPNTVGAEFSSTGTSLSDKENTYDGVQTGRKSALRDAFSYLQALTLSRQQTPRMNREGRWRFLFTPAATFSYKTIFFPEFEKLAYVNFDYLKVGAGIGPEVGYQSGRHSTYFRVVPVWTYYQVDWQQPGGGPQSMAVGLVDTQIGLGYLYFITDRVSLHLFTRGAGGGDSFWNSIAHRVNPTTPPLQSANDNYSGISFGYTFDTRSRLLLK